MRNLVLLAVALYGFAANAGGISFSRKYEGKHPLTGTKLTFERAEQEGKYNLSVENRIGHANGVTISDLPVRRDTAHWFDAQFDLTDSENRKFAKIVTTGDCQHGVASFALVFPSGLQIILHSKSEE